MSLTYFRADFEESKWYVLFVRSNQEKRVALSLNERGIELFLPCYPSVRQWKDRRVNLERPLFPGYVFVRLPFLERMKVIMVPNVVALVGTRNSPSVISEHEIAWIKQGLEHGKATPHEYLEVGERVEITDGAMAGTKGILLRRHNGTRVVISLDSIARAFVVVVDAASVRPVCTQRTWDTPGPVARFLASRQETMAESHSDPIAAQKRRCSRVPWRERGSGISK
jgi:transcription termination/antitermination protein NusG